MMQLQIIDINLCVLRLHVREAVPDYVWDSTFLSVTRTDEELSIVCEIFKTFN